MADVANYTPTDRSEELILETIKNQRALDLGLADSASDNDYTTCLQTAFSARGDLDDQLKETAKKLGIPEDQIGERLFQLKNLGLEQAKAKELVLKEIEKKSKVLRPFFRASIGILMKKKQASVQDKFKKEVKEEARQIIAETALTQAQLLEHPKLKWLFDDPDALDKSDQDFFTTIESSSDPDDMKERKFRQKLMLARLLKPHELLEIKNGKTGELSESTRLFLFYLANDEFLKKMVGVDVVQAIKTRTQGNTDLQDELDQVSQAYQTAETEHSDAVNKQETATTEFTSKQAELESANQEVQQIKQELSSVEIALTRVAELINLKIEDKNDLAHQLYEARTRNSGAGKDGTPDLSVLTLAMKKKYLDLYARSGYPTSNAELEQLDNEVAIELKQKLIDDASKEADLNIQKTDLETKLNDAKKKVIDAQTTVDATQTDLSNAQGEVSAKKTALDSAQATKNAVEARSELVSFREGAISDDIIAGTALGKIVKSIELPEELVEKRDSADTKMEEALVKVARLKFKLGIELTTEERAVLAESEQKELGNDDVNKKGLEYVISEATKNKEVAEERKTKLIEVKKLVSTEIGVETKKLERLKKDLKSGAKYDQDIASRKTDWEALKDMSAQTGEAEIERQRGIASAKRELETANATKVNAEIERDEIEAKLAGYWAEAEAIIDELGLSGVIDKNNVGKTSRTLEEAIRKATGEVKQSDETSKKGQKSIEKMKRELEEAETKFEEAQKEQSEAKKEITTWKKENEGSLDARKLTSEEIVKKGLEKIFTEKFGKGNEALAKRAAEFSISLDITSMRESEATHRNLEFLQSEKSAETLGRRSWKDLLATLGGGAGVGVAVGMLGGLPGLAIGGGALREKFRGDQIEGKDLLNVLAEEFGLADRSELKLTLTPRELAKLNLTEDQLILLYGVCRRVAKEEKVSDDDRVAVTRLANHARHLILQKRVGTEKAKDEISEISDADYDRIIFRAKGKKEKKEKTKQDGAEGPKQEKKDGFVEKSAKDFWKDAKRIFGGAYSDAFPSGGGHGAHSNH